MNLSKSNYMLYLAHPAWLWLAVHDKKKLPAADANAQVKLDAGNRVKKYGEGLFPDGFELGFDGEFASLPRRTLEAIRGGKTPLFQAQFDADGLTCIVDVVEFLTPTVVNLIGITSSTNVWTDKGHTKLKPEVKYGLAFQVHVLEACGYTVNEVKSICINKEYASAAEVNLEQLFTVEDVTNQVNSEREFTTEQIVLAKAVMSEPTIPDISPRWCRFGSTPDWLSLGAWIAIYRTLTEVPKQSIYDLTWLNAKTIGELEDRKVTLLAEIPDDFKLNDKQRRQVEAVKAKRPIICSDQIAAFMEPLEYPLYFLDYETCSDVILPYDGTHPYQQVPFQYSLHVVDGPGTPPRKYDYLHTDAQNPAESLAESLCSHIGDTGNVVVWFASFEKDCNSQLGQMAPKFADFFNDINDRVVDLILPFSNGMYVHPDFGGSASLKKVLPVLIPEMSYDKLSINEGLTAQRRWMETVLGGIGTPAEREQLFEDLREYCGRDTAGMVRIYEFLCDEMD